jgi:hypothetical protein
VLAQIMLILDDSSPSAVVIDRVLPASGARLLDALRATWPRLDGRVVFVEDDLAALPLHADEVVVSSHACGGLTDRVLAAAVQARARVAVLPCCHDLATGDTAALDGWLDGPLAIDVVRAMTLQRAGYRTWTQQIPRAITPKNRLLLGAPRADRDD